MGFSMGYGPAKDEDSKKTLAKAVELGCVFWDSAVVYGAGHNEKLLGDFIREAGCRDKVFVASKCGIEVGLQAFHSHSFETRPADVPLLLPLLHQVDFETKQMGKANNSAAHIDDFIEGTIERLGFTPDLYYLHRIEPGRDLNESITALQRLKENGKCKYIGLSECSAQTLRRACQGRSEFPSYSHLSYTNKGEVKLI